MQLTKQGKVYLAMLLASILFSVFAITFGFFPYIGFSLSFLAFTLIAYFIKKDKSLLTKIFFVITLVLSLSLMIRSEGFLTFLNMIGILYFGSLFATTGINSSAGNVISIIFAPFNLFLRSLFTSNIYHLEFKNFPSKAKNKESTLNSIAIILITILSLVIILPLLSSANPFFGKIFSDFFGLIGLANLTITENIVQWILRLGVFFGLTFLIPRMATFINNKENSLSPLQEGLDMLLPKLVVSVILIVFFITQFQLYFASPQVLSDLGYTFSQYANEVFAQLSAVAAIIIVLLYFDKATKKVNKKMALILAFQGLFLTLMAYKSVYDYSTAWGFTYKRLYGFAVATWITGIFSAYLYCFFKKLDKKFFLITSVIYTGIILILINIVNFDYLIYHFRKAETGQGIDHAYLTRLSSDSLSYKEQLDNITKVSGEAITEIDKLKAESGGLTFLLYKIERLQEKYKDPDIRSINLLEYLQYEDIKNIDTSAFRNKYLPTSPTQP